MQFKNCQVIALDDNEPNNTHSKIDMINDSLDEDNSTLNEEVDIEVAQKYRENVETIL